MSDIPMKHYWRGQDIDDLSREQLVEIIVTLNERLNSAQDMALRSMRMLADTLTWQ